MRSIVWAIMLAPGATACSESLSEEQQIEAVVKQVPWMLEVYQNCESYKGAKAEAAKSDISTQTLNLVRRSSVEEAKGKVKQVLPVGDASDPGSYSIQIQMAGDKIEFSSQSEKRPIAKGTPEFEQVAELEQGDCVTFAATDIEPISTFQRGRVCEHRFYAKLSNITACAE